MKKSHIHHKPIEPYLFTKQQKSLYSLEKKTLTFYIRKGLKTLYILFILSLTSSYMPFDLDLSLEQKLGQFFCISYEGQSLKKNPTLKLLTKQLAGGVLLFGDNISTKEALKENIDHLKKTQTIAPFIAIDQEGGYVQRIQFSQAYPSAKEIARLPESVQKRIYHNLSAELASLGITVNFGLVLDQAKEPHFMAKDERVFGKQHRIIQQAAKHSKERHKAHGVLLVAKHFPNLGLATKDPHQSLPKLGETWRDDALDSFQEILKENPLSMGLMSTHLQANQFGKMPITYSKKATHFIRKHLGFQGLLVSDDLSMSALDPLPITKRAQRAILAGYDMILFNQPKALKEGALEKTILLLIEDIKAGNLSRIHIETRVRKILKIRRWLQAQSLTAR